MDCFYKSILTTGQHGNEYLNRHKFSRSFINISQFLATEINVKLLTGLVLQFTAMVIEFFPFAVMKGELGIFISLGVLFYVILPKRLKGAPGLGKLFFKRRE